MVKCKTGRGPFNFKQALKRNVRVLKNKEWLQVKIEGGLLRIKRSLLKEERTLPVKALELQNVKQGFIKTL
ncbi:MAG: hypothetical protein ABIT08_08910 [Bacteroidia bacterium]